MDAALQMGSHEGRAEGQNSLPHPAGQAAWDSAQDPIAFLGFEHTSTDHVIYQHPHALLPEAIFNPFSTQPVFALELPGPRCKTCTSLS